MHTQTVTLPGDQGQLLVLHIGDSLLIYRMDLEIGPDSLQQILSAIWVRGYEIIEREGTVEIEVSLIANAMNPELRLDYWWDATTETLTPIDWLAEMIFINDNGAEAASTIQEMLSDLEGHEEVMRRSGPRLLYLLGLVHELADHNADAVDVYHQLWREYPESGYAIMARWKMAAAP